MSKTYTLKTAKKLYNCFSTIYNCFFVNYTIGDHKVVFSGLQDRKLEIGTDKIDELISFLQVIHEASKKTPPKDKVIKLK